MSRKNLLIIIFFSSNLSFGQYLKIDNADTIKLIHAKAFKFIDQYIDLIHLTNFQQLRQHKINYITYNAGSNTDNLFNTILTNPNFVKILNIRYNEDSIFNLANKPLSLKFIESNKVKSKIIYCDLGIYPIVRYKTNIFVQIRTSTKGIYDDELGGYLWIILNKNLEIITYKATDVIY